MSRNVTILVIILIILVIAGYLVWLKSQLQTNSQPIITPTPTIQIPTPSEVMEASPTATVSPATPSAMKKVTPSPIKSGSTKAVSTSSAKTVQ